MSQSPLAFSADPSQSTFDFGGHPIRVIVRDGEPWFVATDVCAALGYANTSKAIGDHLDPDEKGVTTGYTLGGEQRLTIISESGLYALVLRSRKPEARKFAKWVTGEVLPAIRKTGGYAKPERLTLSLDDSVRLDRAFHMAAQAAAHVQREVFKCVMESKKPESLASQWMLYFHQKSWGDQAVDAYCRPLPIDAICLSPDAYMDNLERGDGYVLSTEQVTRMAEFSIKNLSCRMRQQASTSQAVAR